MVSYWRSSYGVGLSIKAVAGSTSGRGTINSLSLQGKRVPALLVGLAKI